MIRDTLFAFSSAPCFFFLFPHLLHGFDQPRGFILFHQCCHRIPQILLLIRYIGDYVSRIRFKVPLT